MDRFPCIDRQTDHVRQSLFLIEGYGGDEDYDAAPLSYQVEKFQDFAIHAIGSLLNSSWTTITQLTKGQSNFKYLAISEMKDCTCISHVSAASINQKRQPQPPLINQKGMHYRSATSILQSRRGSQGNIIQIFDSG